jgi:hypothetical protein
MGSFSTVTEVAHVFVLLFTQYYIMYYFLTKKGFGYIWAIFSPTHLVTLRGRERDRKPTPLFNHSRRKFNIEKIDSVLSERYIYFLKSRSPSQSAASIENWLLCGACKTESELVDRLIESRPRAVAHEACSPTPRKVCLLGTRGRSKSVRKKDQMSV